MNYVLLQNQRQCLVKYLYRMFIARKLLNRFGLWKSLKLSWG